MVEKISRIKGCGEGMNIEELGDIFEKLDPSDYITAKMDRNRPYDGQPHTDTGERGKEIIKGLTMRDVRDCFVVGCFEASGLPPSKYPSSLYELPWDEMDPLAVCQNMTCEIERKMGIFPNIER